MSSNVTRSVRLRYGRMREFSCELDGERIVAEHHPPQPIVDVGRTVRSVLESPLDFPPLEQALVPGDRVAIALDSHTPQAAAVIAEVWRVLDRRQVDAADVTIVQPHAANGSELEDPRSGLPDAARSQMVWRTHRPDDETSRAYLASTTSGERIYLARELIEADFVLPIGSIAFDPLMGYRGTGSVFYPGLSTPEARAKARGQGHSELGPDDERPLRQLVDEITWLLGVQFSVQVIAAGGTGISRVLAGASESVQRLGRKTVAEQWKVELDSRPDIVVAAVDFDAAGHGWEQVGAALEASRGLVAQGGKIVILSELNGKLGDGLELIRHSESPRDALKPLRIEMPADLIPATQLAHAADWASVYLLSRLDGELLEELFIVPVESEREVGRLLSGHESCVFLGTAQQTYGGVE